MEIHNKEIRDWIDSSLKQNKCTHMMVMQDSEWRLSMHFKYEQNKPELWFELAWCNFDFSYIKSDRQSNKPIILKRGIMLDSVNDGIRQKILDIDKEYRSSFK